MPDQHPTNKLRRRTPSSWLVLLVLAASELAWSGPASAEGLTVKMLKNTTCRVSDQCGGATQIKLRNGQFSEPEKVGYKASGRVENTAIGDLDGDGIADGALIFGLNTGGNGYFMYMCVFLNKAGKPVQVGSYFIDDRSLTQGFTIINKTITLDVLEHGPKDCSAEPTLRKLYKFTVKGKKLIGPTEIDRRLSAVFSQHDHYRPCTGDQ